jgi:hypothetical protein
MGPSFGLGAVEKREILHCRESKSGVQPVARRYTDWNIPSPDDDEWWADKDSEGGTIYFLVIYLHSPVLTKVRIAGNCSTCSFIKWKVYVTYDETITEDMQESCCGPFYITTPTYALYRMKPHLQLLRYCSEQRKLVPRIAGRVHSLSIQGHDASRSWILALYFIIDDQG